MPPHAVPYVMLAHALISLVILWSNAPSLLLNGEELLIDRDATSVFLRAHSWQMMFDSALIPQEIFIEPDTVHKLEPKLKDGRVISCYIPFQDAAITLQQPKVFAGLRSTVAGAHIGSDVKIMYLGNCVHLVKLSDEEEMEPYLTIQLLRRVGMIDKPVKWLLQMRINGGATFYQSGFKNPVRTAKGWDKEIQCSRAANHIFWSNDDWKQTYSDGQLVWKKKNGTIVLHDDLGIPCMWLDQDGFTDAASRVWHADDPCVSWYSTRVNKVALSVRLFECLTEVLELLSNEAMWREIRSKSPAIVNPLTRIQSREVLLQTRMMCEDELQYYPRYSRDYCRPLG